MKKLVCISVLASSLLTITACGGGGGSDSNPPVTPIVPPVSTAIDKIQDASNYTSSELRSAAISIANEDYAGSSANSEVTPAIAEEAYNLLFGESQLVIPSIGDEDFSGAIDASGNVDATYQCGERGTVRYQGKVESAETIKLSLTYSNCQYFYDNMTINGTAALDVLSVDEGNFHFVTYFGDLQWAYDDVITKLSGYASYKNTGTDYETGYSDTFEQYITARIGENSYKFDMTSNETYSYSTDTISMEGDVYIGNAGKVKVSFDVEGEYPPYLYNATVLIEGTNKAAFIFEQGPVKFVVDTDGDDVYDMGVYYIDVYELLYGNNNKTLFPLDELSLPPSAGAPNLIYPWGDIYTTTNIVVSPGYYDDPDNTFDELTISYRWYLNDVLLEAYTSDTLPAYVAAFGDKLEVSMVVSDGANTIESWPLNIVISDSPTEVVIENLPDEIQTGDYIEFTVAISDPDTGETSAGVALIAGPDGVVVSDSGVIGWQVPDEQLFPLQYFTFVFSEDGATPETYIERVVTVKSDRDITLARSGLLVPSSNNAMHVADITGDGNNELVSTDSNSNVFTLSLIDGRYQQTWLYPYMLPTEGLHRQVLISDVNSDDKDDILIVTEYGVSVVTDTDKMAETLFESEMEIRSATLADIDGDGIEELIYLVATENYSEDTTANVIALDSPETTLFSFDVGNAKEIAVANVDNDSALELIANSGFVYDLVSGENQWVKSNGFGDAHIAVPDFDGDGVSEIVGAGYWGHVEVYSAVTKVQLDNFDNFNTCDISDATLSEQSVLLVGDCQWGDVTAYTMTDGSLSELWRVSSQDHGVMSITVGDIDNDGSTEVLWGTGVSSTGADELITAELNGSTITIKEDATEVQLDSFSSSGWANVIDDEERAIYFISSTESGYGSSRYIMLDKEGNVELSDTVSENWGAGANSIAIDFNNDGAGDLFSSRASYYDGGFAAIQLHNGEIHWQYDSTNNSSIGIIEALDINFDGFTDALVMIGTELYIFDVQNQSVIANYNYGYVRNLAPFVSDGTAYIVLTSDNSGVEVLAMTDAGLSQVASTDAICSELITLNADSDAQPELACTNYSNELVIYEFSGDALIESSRKNMPANIYNIQADVTTDQNQSLIGISHNPHDYSLATISQLVSFGTDGFTRWRSPGFSAQPTQRYGNLKVRKGDSGSLEVQMSSYSSAFWVH
ncbi:VCBS repeat-containing protein [Alteromonas sp. 1_MG-2023]|uniref:FG-GAP repeat domain-containing protein n=1 Tax=Alteromonas sp. 1_MG-2023 TaxID=3062669 RepID=UPI0026E23B8A|nr:VCBS repeat-containing protein [Alteromonas sp. 1_MG-2023]MDO6566827.1 VCBS repeat-containing protein [Alteromonas sp. 1_MG-2023]